MDIYQFKDGIFNLENKNFLASDTKIRIKKDTFEDEKMIQDLWSFI